MTKAVVRRPTDAEIQQRREKGLCYRCDEIHSSRHRCKRRELNVLIVQEEEGFEDELKEGLASAEMTQKVEISLNSVVELMNPKTLQACGNSGEQLVVVLIDPRATHNFLS